MCTPAASVSVVILSEASRSFVASLLRMTVCALDERTRRKSARATRGSLQDRDLRSRIRRGGDRRRHRELSTRAHADGCAPVAAYADVDQPDGRLRLPVVRM